MATRGALQRAAKKPNLNNVKPGRGGSDQGRHAPKPGQEKAKSKPKKPKKPAAPTAETYAQQDPDYRRAVAGYRTNLANLRSQRAADQADLTTDYTTTRNRLLEQNTQNDQNQRADFAARGIFGSGVYAKANADREKEATNQLNDAQSSYSRNARTISTDVANATTLERQQEGTAKAAAIRRATAQYGLTGRPAVARRRRQKKVA